MGKIQNFLACLLLVGVFLPVFATEAHASTVSVVGIAAGDSHTLALKSDGTVLGWGSNVSGELGSGAANSNYAPVPVAGLSNVTALAGGYTHTLALENDGTVWAMGYNVAGELGIGSNSPNSISVPAQVYGLSSVQSIAANDTNSVALKSDGTVWNWGCVTNSSVPTQITGLSSAKAIAAGNTFTLALTTDGTVWAWGDNSNGQLGNNSTTSSPTPVQVSGLTNVVGISAGYLNSVALKSDGTVWTWGSNTFGELGNNSNTSSSVPVQVSGLTNVVAVSAHGNHTVALKSDGTVWSWGHNESGELGNNSSTDSSVPVQAVGLSNVSAIAAGGDFTVARKSDGTVWNWGNDTDGQVGQGYTSVPRSIPLAFDAHLSALNVSPESITFNPDTTSYSLTLPSGESSVTVNAIADDPHATVTFDGQLFPSNQTLGVDLPLGLSKHDIVVTSADGSAQIDYSLDIFVKHPLVSFDKYLYQVVTGGKVTVSGAVYDANDQPIANSSVVLQAPVGSWQPSGKSTDTVTTDVYGNYSDTWQAPTSPIDTTLTATANGASVSTTVWVSSPSTGGSSGGSTGSNSTGSTGSNSTGSTGGNSTGSTGGTTGGSSSGFVLPTVLMQQTVDSGGATQTVGFGNTTLSVQVPADAFSTPESVTVTTGSVLDLGNQVTGLSTYNVPVVFGVNFSGTAPQQPVTVTVKDPNILQDTLVYKLSPDGRLVPMPAQVSQGEITVSFTTDPDFVLVSVQPSQRVITLDNHVSMVPAMVHADSGQQTTYMPIWYVMQLLKGLGINSEWDGHSWKLNTSNTTDMSDIKPGHGTTDIYLNGTLVQEVTSIIATDPSSGKSTTYMPIWYVMQLLNRLALHSTWNGTTWSMTTSQSR